MANKYLAGALHRKNDEFYTMYEDVENELKHYSTYFENKIIYCNCDGKESNFTQYFLNNFQTLKLKKLVCTAFSKDGCGKYLDYDGTSVNERLLSSDGSFMSDECKQLLSECDIVCTNPPFSLNKFFLPLIFESSKKFIILSSLNSLFQTYSFKYFKNGIFHTGYNVNTTLNFKQPDGSFKKINTITWCTNLLVNKEIPELVLTKKYSPDLYPHYDNVDAINVDKSKDIPYDYDGIMGVPISFIKYYNPDKYEIVGLGNSKDIPYTKRYVNPVAHTLVTDVKNFTKMNGEHNLKVEDNNRIETVLTYKIEPNSVTNANCQPSVLYEDNSSPKMNTNYNIICNEQMIKNNACDMTTVIMVNGKPVSYYTADNVDGYLIAPFRRLFIKHKKN